MFWGPKRYAARFYHLRAWHQSQPGEDLSHHKDGPDSKYKGGTTGYGVPRRAQLLHLTPRRMRSPLYRLIKKVDHFEWTSEAQEALDMVKQLLTKALILVPPTKEESLLLYIAATVQVVSAALVVEREEEGHALKVQRPMYFISEVLSDLKTRYPQI